MDVAAERDRSNFDVDPSSISLTKLCIKVERKEQRREPWRRLGPPCTPSKKVQNWRRPRPPPRPNGEGGWHPQLQALSESVGKMGRVS